MSLSLSTIGDRLFGRSLRLLVGLWIIAQEDPVFYQLEVAQGIGYSSAGNVAQELDRLIELGMLQKMDKTPGDRRQYYVRTDSDLWEILRAAERVCGRPATLTRDNAASGRAAPA